MKLIDHHVHGVVTTDLDRAGFEELITEGRASRTMLDTQLGFTIRRWCAPVLDLEPFASADDFLLATQDIGTPVMLLHCYPFHREAGYLANVFPHVYMDLGAILNHVGARSAAVLAEALELTPFHKMLYSSDAFGLPELHYLGAIGFRRDLAAVTDEFVAGGAWASADANYVAKLIGFENAARVYGLELA